VQRVGQRDVHRVHGFETLLELVVAVGGGHAIAARQLTALRRVVAHERGQRRVAPGVSERRQYGHLRDVAKPDDGVPNSCSHG